MNAVTLKESTVAQLQKIVSECMGTEDSFCKARCPMSTDVKAYVNRIAAGDYEGALRIIREKLFLPGTLGRICAHPCEKECRRQREFQQAISIAALKRFAADRADDEALWDTSVKEDTGKRVAIVGSGPAGAQAAIDLRKAGHQVTIYEKNKKAGGMLQYGIPKYRLPREVLDREYTYLDKLGISVCYETEIGKDKSFESLRQEYDAVLLAPGAQKGNLIRVPGADAQGVYVATEYLKEIAETEQFHGAGDAVLIIGGGDVAMDCARSTLRIGAKQVMQCSLESLDILPASKEEYESALEEGIQMHPGWGPKEILIKDGHVAGVRLQKVASVFDAAGRFNPSYCDEFLTLDADTVIMATGQVVQDAANGQLPQIQGGRYSCNRDTLATDLDGVFVAGDAAGGKIVIEAMALGRKAAISINRYLSGQDLLENRDLAHEWAYETKLDVPLPAGTEDLPRMMKNLRPVSERIHDFAPVDNGFTEAQARKEASRCLQCECRLCVKECELMDTSRKCPGEAFSDILAGNVDPLYIYSCNDCGDCVHTCPKDLDTKGAMSAVRQEIAAANGGQSPLPGHRAVKIHQELGFYSMYTTKVKGGRNHG